MWLLEESKIHNICVQFIRKKTINFLKMTLLRIKHVKHKRIYQAYLI